MKINTLKEFMEEREKVDIERFIKMIKLARKYFGDVFDIVIVKDNRFVGNTVCIKIDSDNPYIVESVITEDNKVNEIIGMIKENVDNINIRRKEINLEEKEEII